MEAARPPAPRELSPANVAICDDCGFVFAARLRATGCPNCARQAAGPTATDWPAPAREPKRRRPDPELEARLAEIAESEMTYCSGCGAEWGDLNDFDGEELCDPCINDWTVKTESRDS